MVKYFTLMTVKANQDAAQFRHWFLREHAPQVLKHCPSLRRHIVNLAEPAPAIEHGTGYSSTRYQVVTDIGGCFSIQSSNLGHNDGTFRGLVSR